MERVETEDVKPTWIRGPRLRARWDNMSNTAFYAKVKSGVIPPPHYPFGDATPYWSLAEIEAFEAKAQGRKVEAS
ncbi:hypothetical protein HHL11_07145 [Ramlibacter sp. G-1-2-2]|uniref:AlpA family phage regulatory protein n=1 Tax=Ramlibacter agri TaxID=2728837 RepID=A0A848H763_9BURK|nr:hypothetical protein [Ramlibacter agri]